MEIKTWQDCLSRKNQVNKASLARRLGLNVTSIHAWVTKNNVPSKHFLALEEYMKSIGKNLTKEEMRALNETI